MKLFVVIVLAIATAYCLPYILAVGIIAAGR